MSKRAAFLALTLAVGLGACGGGDKQSSAPAPGSGPVAKAGGAAEFGVPECDEYLTKYAACVDSKVPENVRGTVRQQLEQTKAQWKQAAATPEGKAGLAMGCKQALESAKLAMQAYGCQW